MAGTVRLTVMGAVLLLGGLLWGAMPVEAKGGDCGSLWSHSRIHTIMTRGEDSMTITSTPEPVECPDAREHRNVLVILVIIVGAAALAAGVAETVGKLLLRSGSAHRRTPPGLRSAPNPPAAPPLDTAPFDPRVPKPPNG
ncbi:hypothetical protein ACFYUY_33435 [Kitasatospora sp. NPDC004745]|uniref:hypothetical protein n=1 Tax=Kitasatospora sp. NPDC004745 TaxID=3364019 RepID=UPI003690DC9B